MNVATSEASIPKNVIEQGKKADRLHKEIFGSADDEAVKDDETEETTDVEASAEETGEEKSEPAGESTPAADTSGTQAEDIAAKESTDTEETWEQRYKSLQGIMRSNTNKHNQEIASLQNEINTLRSQVASQSEPTPGKRYLTDEDTEDYGEDLINVVKRAAREEIDAELAALKKENATLRAAVSGVSSTVRQNVRNDLYSTLAEAVPDWKAINNSEDFLLWLEQSDPYSGVIRQDMLTRAFENNDATRVINFFRGFINESGAVKPPAGQDTPTRDPKLDMKDFVAPGKPKGNSGQAQTGAQKDVRVWTQKDVQRFYSDVRAGKYRLNPEEKTRIEQEIIHAANTGNVR
jgi:hypothetical protein